MPTVICSECKAEFIKMMSQCRSEKNNNFCSSKCSATFNNKKRETGYKRSKIELWAEQRIGEQYPELQVHYNKKDAIGSELDIYVPSLKLAIELHGRQHYVDVYGVDILKRTQANDQLKREACRASCVELVEINASECSRMKKNPEVGKVIDQIFAAINKKLNK